MLLGLKLLPQGVDLFFGADRYRDLIGSSLRQGPVGSLTGRTSRAAWICDKLLILRDLRGLFVPGKLIVNRQDFITRWCNR